MWLGTRRAGCGLATATVLLCSTAALAQLERRGPELQVNSYTTENQVLAQVAAVGAQFVVVWSGAPDGSPQKGIGGRRLSGGDLIGAEFAVNAYTVGAQVLPRIAGSSAGFVVVWVSGGQDGNGSGVFGRLFDPAGNRLSVEFQANTYTLGDQSTPSVAMDGTGFVIVWTGGDFGQTIFGRRYDLAASPTGPPFVISTYTPAVLGEPVVALDGAGDFVVVWSNQPDGSGTGLFGRLFDAGDNPLATEFQVSLMTVGPEPRQPDVARNGSGFVIVWETEFSQVKGRRYDSTGLLASGELEISTHEQAALQFPSVALGQAGDFVVVWEDAYLDGSSTGIFARRFNADLTPATATLPVNTYATGFQQHPRVALAGSRVLVAWDSQQDGDSGGIFAQRFRASEFTVDVDGDGVVAPLTDALLLLRYAFGFRGAVLINGAVGAGCTRCDALSIEDYLAGEI